MSSAVVFMADGMEMCECLITVDLLRRAGVDVTTASVMGHKEITSSHRVRINADELAENIEFDSKDLIVLPGGRVGTENLSASSIVIDKCREFAGRDDKWIAAICAAPSIFASMGLLDGSHATCHPDFEHAMGNAVLDGENVVISGNIVMGRALGATFDFALTLACILEGEEAADRIRNAICY